MATLLLLHGLGATRGVWNDMLEELDWSGRVLNLDLPGHGLAAPQNDYTMGALSASVSDRCENGEEIIAVGHSLGGCVSVCLASGFFRPVVKSVVCVGPKITWTDTDLEIMGKVATKGVRWFDTRDDAVDRFMRQAGLVGVVEPDHPAIETGVAQVDGRWRVTQDPATFAQRPVDMAGLMAAAKCPVVLGAGENDSMVARDELAAFVDDPQIASGCGHNPQIEDPAWFAGLVRPLLSPG